jgi:hypothetical protein
MPPSSDMASHLKSLHSLNVRANCSIQLPQTREPSNQNSQDTSFPARSFTLKMEGRIPLNVSKYLPYYTASRS